ncbi:hypothetical protein [Streptomyces sp. NPDC096132]|uniref:hypothetical protein n=1 Tax=Streptomyces sp. NPDC096132 TaxID=3366075 RepID=UPI0037F5C69B
MPRGRHRHSPPLHRLLPPSAIAGVSLICAFGPWVFSDPALLRVVAAVAAATAVVGAAVLRRWDMQAGKQVADLTRARASDEWRFEERVAELETDLDESRELRVKLEQRLRAKRTELAGLRNEHAALLRRYATAETERASALEGRRLLEIETVAPETHALPPARVSEEQDAETAVSEAAEKAETAEAVVEAEESAEAEAEAESKAPAVFSPEGSQLYLRAQAALVKLDPEAAPVAEGDDSDEEEPATVPSGEAGTTEAAQEDEAEGKPEAVDEHARATAPHPADEDDESLSEEAATVPSGEAGTPASDTSGSGIPGSGIPAPAAESAASAPAVSGSTALVRRPAGPVQRPSGHFTVPTAVAVVPAAQPVRRPAVEGGFDFFGTKSTAPSNALEAVQNEDLADVVGQEALALHKAEAEAEFKPAGEESRGVGQVIDLTAHDETEVIDLQGLRSAVS